MSPKAPITRKRRSASKQPHKQDPAPSAPSQDDFLVVAIGASAGGMDAFKELFRHLPANTGMGFIVIQHLDPTHESALAGLLSKFTSMKVIEVTDGMRVVPNHVFVIPPNTFMTVTDHTLHLVRRGEAHGVHTVDQFMRSLAAHQGVRSIGVILSGSGTDGTLGLAEIQAQGGVTFAQEESSARYDGMPHSAIDAGFVDYVLTPQAIARELARLSRHPYLSRDGAAPPQSPVEGNNGLSSIFQLLLRGTGVNFTHYRKGTLLRRLQRRMMVHKIDSINDYLRYLQSNSSEVHALYQDMLINVTSFFRNPKVFEALKTIVFPSLMRNRGQAGGIRIWTPGCATGEETYSVAIALLEYLGDKATQTNIQFFGTDLSEANIAKARAAVYPENIQDDVTPERLRRFFSRSETGYRISKSVRDICIFARHNLSDDPPFSQMDLICCRNLLIYLEPVLQSKVISLFHYALRGNGFLVLGNSEGVHAGNLFAAEDRALKIFSRKPGAARELVTFSLGRVSDHAEAGPTRLPAVESASSHAEAQREFDWRLLTSFSPASAFVDEDFEIVHTRGNITRYLKLAPGRATLNILKMAREGLLFDLRNALSRSKKEKISVRKQKVQVRVGNVDGHGEAPAGSQPASHPVDFEVVPLTIGSFQNLYFMIVFQDSPEPVVQLLRSTRGQKESGLNLRQREKLQRELESTKEYLQSVIETHEATNEELQSANEEILSSNEELQSTNEELETAKEELQSTNEELVTVNDELRTRNLEINQINNDLTNLLSSIEIAVIMVGGDLSIRRFTPQAQTLFGLIAADVGRPLWKINPSLEMPNFQQAILDVIATEKPVERQLLGPQGERYQLRILPYRTTEGAVDGAVVTLMPTPQETR